MPDPRLPAEVQELLYRARKWQRQFTQNGATTILVQDIIPDLTAALERAYALPERDGLALAIAIALRGAPDVAPTEGAEAYKVADFLLARWPALEAKPLTNEVSSENDSVVSRSAASK